MSRVPKLHYDHVARSEVGPLFHMSRAALSHLDLFELTAGMGSSSFEGIRRMLGNAGAAMHHQMVTWDRAGQHVYVLGPQVAQSLAATDLTGVTAHMIDGEAPCFYIALRDSPWQIWGGARTGFHELHGVYVTICLRKDRSGQIRPSLSFMLWGPANERSQGPLDDACFWFSIPNDVDGDLEEIYGDGPALPVDDYASDPFRGSLLEGAPIEVQEQQREMSRAVYRLALNLLLYLDSQQPDIEDDTNADEQRAKLSAQLDRVKSDGKRKKIQRRLAALPTTHVRYIGASIEAKLAQARSGGSCERQVDGRRSPRKHVVRPHWRHYWVGSGADRRKVRKWIALFERGSGDADRTVTIVRD